VERSILSNNVNILTFGAKVISPEIAKELVTLWLSLSYVPGGGSEPKVQRIFEIEKRYMKPGKA
jgi:ribose 5-phosphate isomerase B